MLRTLYSLALPGGRRLVLAYAPPPPEPDTPLRPLKVAEPPVHDRSLAQFGVYAAIRPPQAPARPKRGR